MTRILTCSALALILSGGFALAQQTPPPAQDAPPPPAMHARHTHNAQRETRHLNKVLGLTPDQASRVEPILADRDQKVAALDGQGLAPAQMKQQRRELDRSANDQLGAVLTADQMQQLKAMRHHGPHHGAGAPQAGAPVQPTV